MSAFNLLIYKGNLVALPGLEPGLFALRELGFMRPKRLRRLTHE